MEVQGSNIVFPSPGYFLSIPRTAGDSEYSLALAAVEHLQHLLTFLHPERLREDAMVFYRGEAGVGHVFCLFFFWDTLPE